jgi:hypothetical protein
MFAVCCGLCALSLYDTDQSEASSDDPSAQMMSGGGKGGSEIPTDVGDIDIETGQPPIVLTSPAPPPSPKSEPVVVTHEAGPPLESASLPVSSGASHEVAKETHIDVDID